MKACSKKDCGGYLCEFHSLRRSAQNYIRALLAELEQAEAERDRIKQAAVEAEKLLDAMAMDIGSYLSEPVRKLYAEVHTNLRDALKAEEE